MTLIPRKIQSKAQEFMLTQKAAIVYSRVNLPITPTKSISLNFPLPFVSILFYFFHVLTKHYDERVLFIFHW